MCSLPGPDRLDILEIYRRYCDIVSSIDGANLKEQLTILSKSLEAKRPMREMIFGDIYKLMSCLNFSVDSSQFSCFYDFVFFICRENGQKNITVNRAVAAWRIVLSGRFRLLNHWCSFVEGYQRHNISEDTWQQLLAFSKCVNEDLKGYDSKGAWPILIDDFVDHMYSCRINELNYQNSQQLCGSSYIEPQPSKSNTFDGLNLFPGSKRKSSVDFCERNVEGLKNQETPWGSDYLRNSKRPKYIDHSNKPEDIDSDLTMSSADSASDHHGEMNHGQLGCLNTTGCIVEESLSKGSKRKSYDDFRERNAEGLKNQEMPWGSDYLKNSKRPKYMDLSNKPGDFDSDLTMSAADSSPDHHGEMNKHGQLGCLHTSGCIVEESLSKGFEGYLSIGCCLQFDEKSRIST